MNFDFFPDSRLTHRPDFGSQMVDWELAGGGTVRCEVVPIYCVVCGKLGAYVPKDNTVQATYICNKCWRDDNQVFDGMAVSDEQFMNDVQHEMQARFGHDLTDAEVLAQLERGNLGPALEALLRDSPYPNKDNRPG